MSAHVLLNLLNELDKRDQMCSEFNTCKFNKYKSTNFRFYLSYDINLF